MRAPPATVSNLGISGACASVTALPSILKSVYPLHSNWNDYVHANPTATDTPYNQLDSDCLGTENGYFGCVHGGEKRKIVATGQTTCSGLSAVDTLGAFAWSCDSTQNPVVFYSRNFNTGKGLQTLINAANLQFQPLGVNIIKNGCPVVIAPPTTQWSNPIVNLFPAYINVAAQTALTGGSPGTIYVLNTGTAVRASNGPE